MARSKTFPIFSLLIKKTLESQFSIRVILKYPLLTIYAINYSFRQHQLSNFSSLVFLSGVVSLPDTTLCIYPRLRLAQGGHSLLA